MISIPSNLPIVDARVPADPAQAAAPADSSGHTQSSAGASLADWSKTPNGKAVKQVNFYEAGSDPSGARVKVIERSFSASGGPAVFELYPMSNEPKVFDAKGKIDPKVDPVARDVNGNTTPQKVLVRPQVDSRPSRTTTARTLTTARSASAWVTARGRDRNVSAGAPAAPGPRVSQERPRLRCRAAARERRAASRRPPRCHLAPAPRRLARAARCRSTRWW